MVRRRHAHAATFDDFFAAFSKSVHADVELRDGEIVLAHADSLLNETLAAQHSPGAAAAVGISRPQTRSSPSTKAPHKLPRLAQSDQSRSLVSQDPSLRHDKATPLPSQLAALVALQASDGSWLFDDKFQFVINDVAPPPPEGIAPKLWATAVVVVIFRQCPECFAHLESAYEKAMLHVDDDVLRLAKARVDTSLSALERIRPYQNNEAKEIRDRLAREAAAKRAEEDAEEQRLARERKQTIYISKYSKFRARQLPMETQELMRTTLMADVQTIFPPEQRVVSKQLRPREMAIQSGDAVECCWRRVDGSKLPQQQAQWSICLVRAINSDGKTLDVQYVAEPFERERNVRFKYVRLLQDDAKDRRGLAFNRLRQQWEVPIGLSEELERLQEIEAKRKWRPPWEVRSLPVLPMATEHQPSDIAPAHSPRRRLTMTPESLRVAPLADPVHEELYQNAIAAALAYDKLSTRLPAVVRDAVKRYASAVLFQERFHAFDTFLDVSVGVVQLAVTALEHIERWVDHGPGPHRRMFVWHGQDFIVRLLKSFDFLSVHPQVCEWYGDDFAFSMNPFLMADSIRDLVPDRGLRFTSKLQPLAPENALRVALRMHKQEVESAPNGVSETPSWWPHARYDEGLIARITHCESFVLSYLRSTGYLV